MKAIVAPGCAALGYVLWGEVLDPSISLEPQIRLTPENWLSFSGAVPKIFGEIKATCGRWV